MKSEFLLAFNQICSDRGLSRDVVLEALEMALVSAYRRDADISAKQNVTAKIELETGSPQIYVEKQVVETVTDEVLEIELEEARTIQPDVEVGESVFIEDTPSDFGRIAAQSAKQIILQRIREAERDARYAHYVQQEGEIVHGTVQSVKHQAVTIHMEGTEAILPRSQQVPGERYTLHQRLRAYVLEVRKTGRGPQIVVSRSHSNMLRRLLELEVPEIFNGSVEIKSIAREAGSRSKVAVVARQPGVDPVGACVGMRGVRIQSIVNELGGEKIDVIEWSPNTASFIAKALSPAKVLSVQLEEDPFEGKTAKVVVPDDQLSLAIGRAGQNARLAAKLTGWRIDIQGVTEAATWALKQVNDDPDVLPALGAAAEVLPMVANILRQHEQEKMPYSSEELLAMRQVIEGVRGYYVSLRDAERARLMREEVARKASIKAAEKERQAEIEAARALIPAQSYEIPLDEIGLSARVLGHLERSELETAGDVMNLLAEGDEGLLKLDGIGPKSLAEIKECVEALDLEMEEEEPLPAEAEDVERVEAVEVVEEELEELEEIEAVAPEAEIEVAVKVEIEEPSAEEPEMVVEQVEEVVEPVGEEIAAEEEELAEEAPPVIAKAVEAEVEAETKVEIEAEAEKAQVEEEAEPEPASEEEEKEAADKEWALVPEDKLWEEEDEDHKRERSRRRELIYNEELGEVVARRRRKKSRRSEDWEKYID